jgi:crossover junction endodeoxyribonuclease RusA
VTMPLPDPLLTPNLRLHWAVRGRYVQLQRASAYYSALGQIGHPPLWAVGAVRVSVEVRPRPRMKRHDADNFWGAMKATFDGVADALGADDRNFILGALVWSNLRTSELIVTLTAAD